MPETNKRPKPKQQSPAERERQERIARLMQRPGSTVTWHQAEEQLAAEDAAWAAYRKSNK